MSDDEEEWCCILEGMHGLKPGSLVDDVLEEGQTRLVCEECDPLDRDSYCELFIDDVSGKELNSDGARGAIEEDADVIEAMKAWKGFPRPTRRS